MRKIMTTLSLYFITLNNNVYENGKSKSKESMPSSLIKQRAQ